MIKQHSLYSRTLFRAKRIILQASRGVSNRLNPIEKLTSSELLPFIRVEIKSILRGEEDPAEYGLTLGKVHNLRLAARRINGLVIKEGQTFSFWSVLGRTSRFRGYVAGREVREGCVIPSVGGGICQLSNSLYQAALATGCEIVERHRHTIVLPGSDAERDKDATVAWNNIDLRFRAREELQIECRLTSEHLVIRFRAAASGQPSVPIRTQLPLKVVGAKSCVTCGQEHCSRHSPDLKFTGSSGPTWIMDRYWPEWAAAFADCGGRLLIPRKGRWPAARTAPFAAAMRSVHARLVRGKSPAEVRRALLEGDRWVARGLAKKLTHLDDDLVVALSLVPHLYESGVLDGRRYWIALDRAPLGILHHLLDEAAKIEPESTTLTDFRADNRLVELEKAALVSAEGVITPHAGLASHFPEATQLQWVVSSQEVVRHPEPWIVFPGPATARSGSKIVREAARSLGLGVMVLGPILEDKSLWEGVAIKAAGEWRSRTLAVVQPSVFDTRPDALLLAQSAHVPVAAGPMCGLAPGTYQEVQFGDAETLMTWLRELL